MKICNPIKIKKNFVYIENNIKNLKKYFPGYENVPLNKKVVIEHILRYGDIDEINQIIEMYGVDECKKCW